MVGPETAQARLNGVHDVSARGADVVLAGAGAAIDLGGNHNIRAGDVEVLQRLADRNLGLALRVDVGGVDEIDAGLDGGLDERVDLGLPDLPDVLPDGRICGESRGIVAGEGHGAETYPRDEKTSITEGFVLHG